MEKHKKIALGVDVGGSHITAAGVDINNFKILSETYSNSTIDNKASKETILNSWAKIIQRSLDLIKSEIEGICIAMPGPFDYPNGIGMFKGNDKYESLYKVDVRSGLSKLLNMDREKIYFVNDAFSFAIGAALSKNLLRKRVIGITLGTGFGAAFLIDKSPVFQSELIPENGCLWDKSFKNSIADNYFSTRWFVNRFKELSGQNCIEVKQIVKINNTYTKQLFEEFAVNLSEFLKPHLSKFETEVLLIGGNITKSHHLFLPMLATYLKRNHKLQIEIVDDTEKCNILGSSYLMDIDYWGDKKKLKTFF